MTKRKIGVVTVARSDYGLYVPVLKKIVAHPKLSLALFVSGTHMNPKFGATIQEIKKDGFSISARVPTAVKKGQPVDIARAMGMVTEGFAEVLKKHSPDILLVLGDRYEMHAAAVAAIPFGIPLAHIHGGELTYGAIDEHYRHSLTKLSSLHFATTKEYGKNIIQMGEEPWRVTVSGAPGLDNVLQTKFFSKQELHKKYGINFVRPVLLVTFHPVTKEFENTKKYTVNLLNTLKVFSNHTIVFTYPNADAGGNIIIKAINDFTTKQPNAIVVKNFGQRGYLSMMKHAVAMVGNSSSGIIEAASFKLPVVNIGSRQAGRIRSKNVIDVGYTVPLIQRGINRALSYNFSVSLRTLKNPYGSGHAANRIVSVLAGIGLKKLKVKKFNKIG